jgi:predicted NBD/HSP70 family sugar kinase
LLPTFGGTHLRSAVADQDGNIRLRLKQKTPCVNDPEQIVAAMVTAFRECEQRLTDSPIDFVS